MAYEANLGLIALTRFGYGPRGDGDVAIAASDPRGFLKAELAQPGIALLSGPTLPPTRRAVQQFFKDQQLRKMEREQQGEAILRGKQAADLAGASPMFAKVLSGTSPAGAMETRTGESLKQKLTNAGPMNPGPMTPSRTPEMAGPLVVPQPVKAPARPPSPEQLIFRDEALARLRRAIEVRVGLAERLVAFWSNHFCISANKGGIARVTAGCFEREAIRPHVFGTFSDMLVAVESHPAMLHFLDNAQSVGPFSKAGQRGKRGLNENLGREIMELHTMGVGSGYTQADVTNLARIITGWSYVGQHGVLGEPGTFVFNANTHEPGPIELLGKMYREDGFIQGQQALLDIAHRPETARFIAGKFARAFIADPPPKPLVDRLAQVFRETGGDLRALTFALIDAPEAWSRQPGRMRTPYELLVATNRILGHLPEDAGQIVGPLNVMGMGLWTPPGPNGYPEQIAAWASAEGMKLRLDYCAQVAGRIKDPPNPSDLLEALCGGEPSPQTRDAIARAESRQQGLALLLMSPEMQRS